MYFIAGTGSKQFIRTEQISNRFDNYIKNRRERYKQITLISGMSEGWDEFVAIKAIELQIPFIAVVPYVMYGVHYWGKNSLQGKNRLNEFTQLLSKAQKTIYTCNSLYVLYDKTVIHANFFRNQTMVDMANEMAVYDRSTPGTRDCVQRAKIKLRTMYFF